MNPYQAEALHELLFQLEQQLMDPIFRKNSEQVSKLLAQEFFEFGSSGRAWTRAEILDLLSGEPIQPAPAIEDFAVHPIVQDLVQVTYRTVRLTADGIQDGKSQAALRSSLWIFRDSRWQILFHQGTKIPEA
jgi:hypothetical protein